MYNKTGRLNTAKMKRIKPTGSAFKMHQNIRHSIEYFIKSVKKNQTKKNRNSATLFFTHLHVYRTRFKFNSRVAGKFRGAAEYV